MIIARQRAFRKARWDATLCDVLPLKRGRRTPNEMVHDQHPEFSFEETMRTRPDIQGCDGFFVARGKTKIRPENPLSSFPCLRFHETPHAANRSSNRACAGLFRAGGFPASAGNRLGRVRICRGCRQRLVGWPHRAKHGPCICRLARFSILLADKLLTGAAFLAFAWIVHHSVVDGCRDCGTRFFPDDVSNSRGPDWRSAENQLFS